MGGTGDSWQETESLRTRADESCYMSITGHFSVGNFLNGAIDCVEEGFCFIGSWHLLQILRFIWPFVK